MNGFLIDMLTEHTKRFLQWLCPPNVFDFWMSQCKINYRWETPTAKVVSYRLVNDSVIQLTLLPSQWFTGFQTGQHISLIGVVNGIVMERCYSIANLPNSKNLIELSVKVQGTFSQWLRRSIRKNSVLEISQAWGKNHTADYDVFIAGGIGITAIYPLVKQAVARQKDALAPRSVTLLYLAGKGHPWIYKKSLEALSVFNLNVVFADGREAITDKNFLRNTIPRESRVICCGSASFNQAIARSLADYTKALDIENFDNSAAIAPVTEKKNVTITLLQSGRTLETDNQTPVISALINAGVPVKNGCRQGVCHQCSCQLETGAITQKRQQLSVRSADANKQSFQPCIALAQSDIALNL